MSAQEQARIVKRLTDVIAHYRGCGMVRPDSPGCSCGQMASQAVARADGLKLYRFLTTQADVRTL